MPTILVVTRNTALGVALTHSGYEVADVRPDRHGDWTRDAQVADAVVLELSDAVAADSAVRRLRDAGVGVPVLIVTNATPGWDVTAAHAGPGTSALPLPISLTTLKHELDRLVAAGHVAVPPPPSNENELLSAVAASVGLTIDETGRLERDADAPPHHPPPAAEPEPEAVAEPEPEPEPVVAAPPPPPPEPPAAAPDPVSAPPPPAPVTVPARTALTTHSTPPVGADVLVVALTEHAGELLGVAECAEVVVAELVERTGADAAVLLLPDGDLWRVAGGVNLRPLEHRAHLAADHWLVQSVVLDGKGLVVDDTDGARDHLHGAPLASWPRLLAVPVPDVGGLFLAARHDAAFQESLLGAAVDVASEAAPLLRDALAVRELARALAPHADLDDA